MKSGRSHRYLEIWNWKSDAIWKSGGTSTLRIKSENFFVWIILYGKDRSPSLPNKMMFIEHFPSGGFVTTLNPPAGSSSSQPFNPVWLES
jgi:hypothetical protein